MLYIRNELNPNEHRAPIVPRDIPILLESGYIVYVESSKHRVYTDEEYEAKGAIITTLPWHAPEFKPTKKLIRSSGSMTDNTAFQGRFPIVIGLKELGDIEKLDSHTHIYFAHCHKQQKGSEVILDAFKKSNSRLYDFEHFIDEQNKRLISFGFYAGIAGCLLGLLQYIQGRPTIKNLACWNSKEEAVKLVKKRLDCRIGKRPGPRIGTHSGPRIGLIGAHGNCGKGVVSILDELGLSFDVLTKNSDPADFTSYDVFFNCILLDAGYDKIWFSPDTVFSKHIIIVDISCDYSKPNNPIAIYDKETTWEEPVYSYSELVDIIAINNLPSLLPKDSSDYFSNRFYRSFRSLFISI